MINNLWNSIPSDFTRRYLFDWDWISNPSWNAATVTNWTYVKSLVWYQLQCLNWWASTICTYSSVTYTNSYIWIYSSWVWIFTKNSSIVTATAINWIPWEKYAMLTFFNRTLTESEEQLLKLEWLRKLWPSNIASYPKLFDWLVWYWDFKWTAHNLVDWVAWTVTWATLTNDRFWNSNSAYSFDWTSNYINIPNNTLNLWTITFSQNVCINTYNNSWFRWFMGSQTGNWLHFNLYWTTSSDQVICFYTYGTIPAPVNIPITYSLNTYFNITVVYDNVNKFVKYYKDWILINSNTYTTAPVINVTTQLDIWRCFNTSRVFSWKIDDTIVLNKALSADEVKQLYQLTSQDYIYPTPSYDLPSLREWLVLDLNEQWQDLSWNWNHWTLVNSPIVVRQGKAKWLSYNGSNQYLTSSYSPNITSPITFSGWYKTSANYSTTSWLILWKFNWWNNYWLWLNTSNILTFYVWWSSNWVISDNVATNDNKWHKYDAIYDWTNIKLYRDWILKQTLASWTCSPIWNLRFATFWDVLWYYFNWNITSPKIRNRALSDKEIQALYYSQKGSFIY